MNFLLIFLVNLLFYHRTLSYGYVSDDIAVANHPEPIPKNKWQTFWINFRGQRYTNPRLAHSMTLGVHIFNSWLIYAAFGLNVTSLCAGLFFAVNPINTQGGSVWISGRPYSHATTCVLAMYALPWLAPLFYGATVFFSAAALFGPLPFLLTRFWFWVFLPPIFVGAFYSVIMKKWNLNQTSNKEMKAIVWRKIIPFLKTFGYYFRISIMPYKQGLYHPFLWGLGVNKKYNECAYKKNRDFWVGAVIFLLTALHIIFIRNLVSFGLFWYMVNIAMWCNIVTTQQQIGERYIYLSNVGLMIALAGVVTSLWPPLNFIFATAILTYYATRLWHYRESYLNDYWHIEYNVLEFKDAHYAWVARGIKKFYIFDFDGALRDFGEARTYIPHDFKQNMNMATMFLVLGDIKHCEEFLQHARESTYDGVEESQIETYVKNTEELLDIVKKTGKIELQRLRIIK